MTSPSPSASIEDLYEELTFIDVLEESLDPGADDHPERKAEIIAKRDKIVARISALRHGPSPAHTPSRNGDTGQSSSTFASSSLRPSNGKRPRDLSSSPPIPTKRHTPEPSNHGLLGNPAQRSHRAIQERARDAAILRQRAAETAALRQHEDERFARSLSQSEQFNLSPSSSANHSRLQATIDPSGSVRRPVLPLETFDLSSQAMANGLQQPSAPQSRQAYQTTQPRNNPSSIKPESMSTPRRPPPNPRMTSATEIVDLTGPSHVTSNQHPRPTTAAPTPDLYTRQNFPPMPVRNSPVPTYSMPGAWPGQAFTSYNPMQSVYQHPSYGMRPNPSAPMPHFTPQRNLPPGFVPVTALGSERSHFAGLMNGSAAAPFGVDDSDDDDNDGDDLGFLLTGHRPRNPYDTMQSSVYQGYEDLYQRRYDAIANYDPAQTQEEINALLNNIRPDEDMPAHLRVQTPAAMAIQLHKYQELGLTWLQNCETGTNKGGILADDMGLGKTIQMLSLIVTRRSEDPKCKTTLIVAPVALMRQWKQEIEQKVRPGLAHRLNVFVHHGPAKKRSFGDFAPYDVVLTTFGSVAAEVKKLESFRLRRHNDPSAEMLPKERCVLIGDNANWYRVILDEAQCIKNRSTQTAKGACLIQAKYRFCVTGTPMMNNVDELYSLIKFLRIKPYDSWEKFRMDITTPLKSPGQETKARAMQRLQTVCKAVMLRRTKKSTFEGKPILILPERTTEIDNPVFNEDEASFYDALEQSTQLQFNKYFKAGTVGKQYTAILLLLLRLRQACCHPHLVRDFGVAAAADVTPEHMLELAQALKPDVVARIKEKVGLFDCPICLDASPNPAIFIPCGHDCCADCFAKITDPANGIAAGNESGNVQAKCPNCRGPINAKEITDFETFKRVYQPELLTAEERQEMEAANNGTDTDDDSDDEDSETEAEDSEDIKDPTLGGFIVNDDVPEEEISDSEDDDDLDRPFRKFKRAEKAQISKIKGEGGDGIENGTRAPPVITDEAQVDESKDKVKSFKPKKSRKKKGKEKKKDGEDKTKKKGKKSVTLAELKKRAARSAADKKKYIRRLREDWISSAKIDKTLDLLKTIMEDPEGEKVLIFSQWTSFLDLLEVPIDGNGWGYRRYDGSMNAGLRSDAIDDFRDARKNVRIMLVSLKAGNAGLNLNMASQVIILDPFWNPFIEEQAIDRAHRLGQTRPVKVHRVLVENTVEDRICKLQEDKRALISQALDEKAGQNISRLGLQELSYLFGISSSSGAGSNRQAATIASSSNQR